MVRSLESAFVDGCRIHHSKIAGTHFRSIPHESYITIILYISATREKWAQFHLWQGSIVIVIYSLLPRGDDCIDTIHSYHRHDSFVDRDWCDRQNSRNICTANLEQVASS